MPAQFRPVAAVEGDEVDHCHSDRKQREDLQGGFDEVADRFRTVALA